MMVSPALPQTARQRYQAAREARIAAAQAVQDDPSRDPCLAVKLALDEARVFFQGCVAEPAPGGARVEVWGASDRELAGAARLAAWLFKRAGLATTITPKPDAPAYFVLTVRPKR